MGPDDRERRQVFPGAMRIANTNAYGFADTDRDAYRDALVHAECVAAEGEHAY